MPPEQLQENISADRTTGDDCLSVGLLHDDGINMIRERFYGIVFNVPRVAISKSRQIGRQDGMARIPQQ
jgi:hypothetical protein